MAKIVDILPAEGDLRIEHTNEIMLLDPRPYKGGLKAVDYGVDPSVLSKLPGPIPEPRRPEYTHVVNLRQAEATPTQLKLTTNYTTMGSRFAIRRLLPALNGSPEKELIEKAIRPLGVLATMKTSDGFLMMEERGNIEMPGQYAPLPAGMVETYHPRVFPNPDRVIMAEAWEETAQMHGVDFETPRVLGMMSDQADSLNPTVVYGIHTRNTLQQVTDMTHAMAPDSGESKRVFGVRVDEEVMVEFAEKNMAKVEREPKKMTGYALASILLFGQREFGVSWRNDLAGIANELGWNVNVHEETF